MTIQRPDSARVLGVSAESTRARLCQRPGRIRLGADVPGAGIRESGSTHPIKARSNLMRTPQSHTARENLPSRSALEDLRMPVQAKLAAAWTSCMFLYIYVDYFGLY